MTEPTASPSTASAGRLLREARERQGMHVAVLAASMKVPVRKLEALEADRLEELHDAAHTRALAQTVCRALKIDPHPVLALLPTAQSSVVLEGVGGGLKMPFREPGATSHPGERLANRPLVWLGAALLVAAFAMMAWPTVFGPSPAVPTPRAAVMETVPAQGAAASQPDPVADVGAAGAATATPTAAAPQPRIETVHAAPAAEPTASSPATGGTALQIRVTEPSWVEITDGGQQLLLSRIVQPGETVQLEGALPLSLAVGNAAGTRVVFRGQPVDLGPATRSNVARLRLD